MLRFAGALLLTTALAGAQPRSAGPWTPLFNGRDLDGWMWSVDPRPPAPSWAAEAGLLRTTPDRGVRVYLLTKTSYADFELEFEWKGEAGCNSGIKYRFQGYVVDGKIVHDPGGAGRIEPVGLEYQIIDDEAHIDALNDPKHVTGALYEYWPPKKDGPTRAVGWHSGRIVARGLHIEHWVDGRKVVDVALDAPEVQASFAGSSRKGSSPLLAKQERRDSPIALQFHDGNLWFRNLRIRRL